MPSHYINDVQDKVAAVNLMYAGDVKHIAPSGKRDCHRASQLECLHGWSVYNLLWQLIPVWDHSNAEHMFTAEGLPPLLVNLERVTSKPNAGGGSKDYVAWKVEKAVHYFVHADKVTTDSSTDKGKKPQPLEGCLVWDVAQPLHKPQRKFLNTF